MSAALIQKLRYMARQYTAGSYARGGNPPTKHYLDEAADLLEQYHREASARCPDCGETNPAEIHTCSPQKPTSAEPVGHVTSWRDVDGDWHASAVYYGEPPETMTKLFTAPPDAEALRKRVAELEAEVERLRGVANDILQLANDAMLDANRGGSEYDREETVAEFKAALATRKEG